MPLSRQAFDFIRAVCFWHCIRHCKCRLLLIMPRLWYLSGTIFPFAPTSHHFFYPLTCFYCFQIRTLLWWQTTYQNAATTKQRVRMSSRDGPVMCPKDFSVATPLSRLERSLTTKRNARYVALHFRPVLLLITCYGISTFAPRECANNSKPHIERSKPLGGCRDPRQDRQPTELPPFPLVPEFGMPWGGRL